MKRIAVLGATGSIGRQALEIIDAQPELEVCALASGSSELDALASGRGVEHAQVGGDLTEFLDKAEPDVVLNAVVGFAGLPATMWALEHGVTLALANKESLVLAGELTLAAKQTGVEGCSCRSTASTPRSFSASRDGRPRRSPRSC